jgi:uncharacterized protein (TIGR02598 family)
VKTVLRNAAFSLVEVTLAMGVGAFCLIALFGLLPIGINADRQAIGQSISTDIMSAVYSDLRATPITSTCNRSCGVSVQFAINFAGPTKTLYFDATGNLTTTTSTTNLATYRATISFPTNPGAPTKGATLADLKITWPAAVDPATGTPAGTVETVAAFDRNY